MNNFDQSSNGVNIQLDLNLDSDLGHFYFEQNFHEIDLGDCRLYIYTDFGNRSYNSFELFDVNNWKITKKDLIDLLNDYTFDLKSVCLDIFGISFGKLNKQKLLELSCYIFGHDDTFKKLIKDFDLINFKDLDIIGYCQGDKVKVLFPLDLIKEFNPDITKDLDKFFSEQKEYLTDLFYGCPYNFNLEVNGMDISIERDEYNYDKGEIFKAICNSPCWQKLTAHDKAVTLQWVTDNLPESL